MAKKSQNGTLDCDYFIFLAHFAFPIVKHWHVLKTAILTVVDMTILRYEERIVRLVRKETAEEKRKKKKKNKKKKKKTKKKKNTRSRIESRTFYIESVSLVNGKGDEFVGN